MNISNKNFSLGNLPTEKDIIEKWQDKLSAPLVSVLCLTYNQEKYIPYAIEGFLKQKTNFPFEVIIGEDCSSDETLAVVNSYQQEYQNIITVVSSKENVGANNNFFNIAGLAKGKYLAICEGDDYWVDSEKLQLQADMLNQNNSIGLVYTNYYQYGAKRKVAIENKTGMAYLNSLKQEDFYISLLKQNLIATCTTMFRSKLLKAIDKHEMSGYIHGDYFMWLEFANHQCIRYLDRVTTVYRILPESLSRGRSVDKKYLNTESRANIRAYYLQKYPINLADKKSILLKEYKELFKSAYLCEKTDKMQETHAYISAEDSSNLFYNSLLFFRKNQLLRKLILILLNIRYKKYL